LQRLLFSSKRFRAAERMHHSAAEINDAFFSDLKRHFSDSSQPPPPSNCSPVS
jgi:hypothetical protein